MDTQRFQYLIVLSPPWLRRPWEDRLNAQRNGVSLGEYRQRTSALSAQLNQILSQTPQWQEWSRKERAGLLRKWYNYAFPGEMVFVAELQKMSPQGIGRMLDRYTAIPPDSSRRETLLSSWVIAYRAGESPDFAHREAQDTFFLAPHWQQWSQTDQEDLVHLCSQLPQQEREELFFLLRYTNHDERDELLDLVHPLSSQERLKLLHGWLSSSMRGHDYSSRYLTPLGKPLLAFLVE